MKQIRGKTYLHISGVPLLPDDVRAEVEADLEWVEEIDPTIIVVSKSTIQFVNVPDWDTRFEPTVGKRLTFKRTRKGINRWLNCRYTRAVGDNPLIYHRRHLFVPPGYEGFDVELDLKRVEWWSAHGPDPLRMGRRKWWSEWIKTLPGYGEHDWSGQ